MLSIEEMCKLLKETDAGKIEQTVRTGHDDKAILTVVIVNERVDNFLKLAELFFDEDFENKILNLRSLVRGDKQYNDQMNSLMAKVLPLFEGDTDSPE